MDSWLAVVVGGTAGLLGAWIATRLRGAVSSGVAAPPPPAPAVPAPTEEALLPLARREEALDRREERLQDRALSLDRRDEALREAEQRVARLDAELGVRLEEARERVRAAADLEAQRRAELEQVAEEARRRLAEIARLTEEEARRRILADLEADLAAERRRRVDAALAAARAEADEKAREILLTAMQRMPAETSAASTVVRVSLENEEMKGRIIGREGRNIRAFEAATGCDVLLDETPGSVTISGFDPVRREVARRAMTQLLADGRVQPARIEEVVAEAGRGMEAEVREIGREACLEAEVHDLHPRLVEMLGRMHYRTSFGQNALRHSVECGLLAGMIAAEIGLEPALARRAGLLHDIGKVAGPEVEGTHHEVAAEIARRCQEDPRVVNAIASSHEGEPVESPYAVVAQIADALSAARPGARRLEMEGFLRRVKELETLASSFPGVTQAYALEAGREVRVLVDAAKVSDATAPTLAFEIARAIEERLDYPGEVRVTVLRETRSVEIAR